MNTRTPELRTLRRDARSRRLSHAREALRVVEPGVHGADRIFLGRMPFGNSAFSNASRSAAGRPRLRPSLEDAVGEAARDRGALEAVVRLARPALALAVEAVRRARDPVERD